MGMFDKLFGSKNMRICSSCGKSMKKYYGGVFPSEDMRDTVESLCANCGSLLCNECRGLLGVQTCPKCGSNVFIAVNDEHLDELGL